MCQLWLSEGVIQIVMNSPKKAVEQKLNQHADVSETNFYRAICSIETNLD